MSKHQNKKVAEQKAREERAFQIIDTAVTFLYQTGQELMSKHTQNVLRKANHEDRTSTQG